MANYIFKLTISGPEDFSQVYEIPVGLTSIGRQSGNELVLPDGLISRVHARLEAIADECHIIDLGSSNGTSVNTEKIQPNAPCLLKTGDQIKIGPFYMNFEQIEVEGAELPPEEPQLSVPDGPVEEAPPPPKKAPAKKRRKPKTKAETPPPSPPEPPPPTPTLPPTNGHGPTPHGMPLHSQKLLGYLPGIYHTDFMARFLGLFESIQMPIEWTVDHFDLFLDPNTSPDGFLPWLSSWFGITFDSTWSEEKRRTLLKEAHIIYARRGTRWALSRVLEIYTGTVPDIDDTGEKLDAFTFEVSVQVRKRDVDAALIEALIDNHKPAHTNYKLKFKA